jgi:hypothetical protein
MGASVSAGNFYGEEKLICFQLRFSDDFSVKKRQKNLFSRYKKMKSADADGRDT